MSCPRLSSLFLHHSLDQATPTALRDQFAQTTASGSRTLRTSTTGAYEQSRITAPWPAARKTGRPSAHAPTAREGLIFGAIHSTSGIRRFGPACLPCLGCLLPAYGVFQRFLLTRDLSRKGRDLRRFEIANLIWREREHGCESSWYFLIESWRRWPYNTSPRNAGKAREEDETSGSAEAPDVPYLPAIGSFSNRSRT